MTPDQIAQEGARQLRAIEAGHRRQAKRIEAFHEFLRQAVCVHGCAAGMSTDVAANITGPKTPPNDD